MLYTLIITVVITDQNSQRLIILFQRRKKKNLYSTKQIQLVHIQLENDTLPGNKIIQLGVI